MSRDAEHELRMVAVEQLDRERTCQRAPDRAKGADHSRGEQEQRELERERAEIDVPRGERNQRAAGSGVRRGDAELPRGSRAVHAGRRGGEVVVAHAPAARDRSATRRRSQATTNSTPATSHVSA